MAADLGFFTRMVLGPLGDLLRALDSLHDRVEGLVVELQQGRAALHQLRAEFDIRSFESRLAAMERRQADFDSDAAAFRRQITAGRELPGINDAAHYALADEYVKIVDQDLVELAEMALRAVPTTEDADSDPSAQGAPVGTEDRANGPGRRDRVERAELVAHADPEVREAALARDLVAALFADGARDAVAAIVGAALSAEDQKKVDAVVIAADRLRTAMAEYGASFAWLQPEEETRSRWWMCEPGRIAFVVAPAYMVNGVPVADTRGVPAGPWVTTRS